MKIEIGEYVRTKSGCIYKIEEISKDKYLLYEKDTEYKYKAHFSKDVIVCSKNIIDLIQIGDYVNGQKIVKITKDPFIKDQIDLWTDRIIPFDKDYQQERFIENEIESIVTKEQFKRAEYKLED